MFPKQYVRNYVECYLCSGNYLVIYRFFQIDCIAEEQIRAFELYTVWECDINQDWKMIQNLTQRIEENYPPKIINPVGSVLKIIQLRDFFSERFHDFAIYLMHNLSNAKRN